MKVEVRIEEVLAKTIQIEIPENVEASDRENYIDNKVEEMYINSHGKSILSAEDFTGYVEVLYEDNNIMLLF